MTRTELEKIAKTPRRHKTELDLDTIEAALAAQASMPEPAPTPPKGRKAGRPSGAAG